MDVNCLLNAFSIVFNAKFFETLQEVLFMAIILISQGSSYFIFTLNLIQICLRFFSAYYVHILLAYLSVSCAKFHVITRLNVARKCPLSNDTCTLIQKQMK